MKRANDGGEGAMKNMGESMIMDVAEDTGTRGLIRAARKSCPCDNEENVEDDPERSDTDDDARDGHVNPPKIARQRATK